MQHAIIHGQQQLQQPGSDLLFIDRFDASAGLYQHSDNGEQYNLLHLASWNGHEKAVAALLDANANVQKPTELRQQTALILACRRGRSECVQLLLENGANVHQRAADGSTALTSAVAMGHIVVLQKLLSHGAADEAQAQEWMGLRHSKIAEAAHGRNNTAVTRVLRAYESQFTGNILPEHGCACVASWPGIYAMLWDQLVAKGKASELSAAVTFLPEHTLIFGEHSDDKCFCKEMYGRVQPWGCKVRISRSINVHQ